MNCLHELLAWTARMNSWASWAALDATVPLQSIGWASTHVMTEHRELLSVLNSQSPMLGGIRGLDLNAQI